jgi:hypothetical protein
MRFRFGILPAVLCAAAAAGCRFTLLSNAVLAPDVAAIAAPGKEPRPTAKTVPLEIVFVRLDSQDSQFHEEFWSLVDEQVFDDALRRRLGANGLRAGVVTTRLPTHLARRFQSAATEPADDEEGVLPEPPSARPAVVRRTMSLLPGLANEVVAAGGIDELVLLEHDGADVRGETLQRASSLFLLRAWPAADGRVRLQFTPTIKHGPLERSWVGEEGVFRLETGQRKNLLRRLRFEANVPIDAMVVVSCAGDEASTVGDAFFRDRDDHDGSVRLLAIRPLSPAVDPMFATPDAAVDASGSDSAADADPVESQP